jgi:hypothetical protein
MAGAQGQTPEFVLRDFTGGMSNNDAREQINDNDLWWCENLVPVARGNLMPVNAASAALASLAETGLPSYTTAFTIITGGAPVNYIFAAFANSGNAYIILTTNFTSTKIISGLLSASGGTFATGYGNLGLLIIDPNGYWDWNVTVANTLTAWNDTIIGATLITTSINSVAGGTTLKQILTGPVGTGAVFHLNYQVISAQINAAGTGYVVGDSLSLTDNNPTVAAQIIVTAVGGGGTITGISLPVGGSYPGPTSTSLVATGPSGNTVSGGSGTGATFTVKIQAIDGAGTGTANPTVPLVTNNSPTFTLVTQGRGYTNIPFNAADETGASVIITAYAVFSSGIIGGKCIATYAGRVWIATGQTIYFTEVGSYNNFGGSGSFFTLTDSYIHGALTCLFSANNYLYIFSASSIDVLSNVTVVSGVVSFSRINVTTSVGTTSPGSVFGFYRLLVFWHSSGMYFLSGASTEKVSEKISGLTRVAQPLSQNGSFGCPLYIQGELCAVMQFSVNDTVTTHAGVRPIMTVFFRNRWWVLSANFSTTIGFYPVSAPSILVPGDQYVMYFWGTVANVPNVYQAFVGASLSSWILKTKLWDGGAPFREKQALNAGVGGSWKGLASSGVTVAVDSETASSTPVTFPLTGSPNGYQRSGPIEVQQGGGSYLGLTLAGDGTDLSQLDILVLRGLTERDMTT